MTHAYSDLYVESAQDILGHAFDWVVNTCGADLTTFFDRFSHSTIAVLFGTGYPKYVAGCNGAELVNFVMDELGLPEYDQPHEFYADRSPEYWAGWVLAYFQWKNNLVFRKIFEKISIERIIGLYHLGHEQDVRNVADVLTEWMAG